MKNASNLFMGIFVFLGFVLMVICYVLRTVFFMLPILIPLIAVIMIVALIVRNRGKKR